MGSIDQELQFVQDKVCRRVGLTPESDVDVACLQEISGQHI